MKQEKVYIFLFMIIISIIQSIQLIDTVHESIPNWPIPFLLLISLPPESPISFLIIWYIGFATTSFFVKGNIKDMIEGYGKYILVRNYSKYKFIGKNLFSSMVCVIGLTLFQFFIFYIVSLILNIKNPYIYWDNMVLGKALLLYVLIISSLILIQMVLELFFSPTTSFLIVNCYVTLSISSWSYLTFVDKGNLIIYLGIPNYAMALRTDAFVKGDLAIDQDKALLIIVFLIIIFILSALGRMKKIDIY
jgi:Protein of unknown function (DUF2705)